MKKKHQKILEGIFARPVSGSIKWKEIESLFQELGAEISEREGCRVGVKLFGEIQVFHRPVVPAFSSIRPKSVTISVQLMHDWPIGARQISVFWAQVHRFRGLPAKECILQVYKFEHLSAG